MNIAKSFFVFIMCGFTSFSIHAQCVPSIALSVGAGSNPGCKDSLLGFTTTTNNLGTTPVFKWFINGVLQTTASAYFTSSSLNDGDGIYVIAYGAGCTSNDSATSPAIKLSIKPTPVVDFTVNKLHPCPGDTLIFTATDTTLTSYQWNFSSTPISGATNYQYIVPPHALGDINLSGSNGGCTIKSVKDVAVGMLLIPAPRIITNNFMTSVLCPEDSLQLDVTPRDTLLHQWKLNGINIPGATTGNTYFAKVAGIYTVSDTVYYCEMLSPGVTIKAGSAPNVNVTASQSVFCEGDSALLIATFDPTFYARWQMNGAYVSFPNHYPYYPDYMVKASGFYHLTVTNNDGCSTTSPDIFIAVNLLPTPIINRNGSTLYTGTYISYQWNLNGVPIPGANTNAYQATQYGHYTVTVKDANGCENISAPFPPNIGGMSVTSPVNAAIKIYPDPATTLIYINSTVKVNVSLFTMDGKAVMTRNDATALDITNLTNGCYIIRISDLEGRLIKVDKIIKM